MPKSFLTPSTTPVNPAKIFEFPELEEFRAFVKPFEYPSALIRPNSLNHSISLALLALRELIIVVVMFEIPEKPRLNASDAFDASFAELVGIALLLFILVDTLPRAFLAFANKPLRPVPNDADVLLPDLLLVSIRSNNGLP